MADDGMFINFDTTADTFRPLPKFKGGNWKDKLTAKKSAKYNQNKSARQRQAQQHSDPAQGENADASQINPPAKRQKTETPAGAREYRKKSLQVVSSLFSYNPKSTVPVAEQSDPQDKTPTAPSNAPLDPALANFMSLGVSRPLAETLLKRMEIKAPTAIQRAALTKLLDDDTDAFLQAETGSGKTLAYLLPIVQRLMSASQQQQPDHGGIHRDSGLFAIILAPTRELSKQISAVLENLLRCASWLVPGTVIGGEKKKSEKARLRKGLNILIATPGRLADHLDHTEVLDVGRVKWLVLDEGDRLMEMGFEKDIDKILSKLDAQSKRHAATPGLPARRVTYLCSATMKNDVQKLGERSLKDAMHVQGKPADSDSPADGIAKEDAFSAPAQLQQSYAVVPAKQRLVTLVALLKRTFARRGSVMKAIVFISCADSVDFHFEALSKAPEDAAVSTPPSSPEPEPTAAKPTTTTSGTAHSISSKDNPVQIYRLHGSLPQAVRTSTLSKYRQTKDAAVLICTDVASRGLDLPHVDLVVEYDPAFSKDEHLHRIGRTARAGNDGRALVFLQPGCEERYVRVLDAFRSAGGRAATGLRADDLLRRGFGSLGLGAGADWEARATDWQLGVERWALSDRRALELARRAFQSHVRAYATHVAAERDCFDLGELHLGHLAKAFALRDKPGSMRVPGQRPGVGATEKGKAERRAKAGAKRRTGDNDDGPRAVDVGEGRRKMHAMMRAQASVSEFNIG